MIDTATATFIPTTFGLPETIGKLAAAELQNLNQLAYLQQLQEQDLEFTAQLLQHSPEMAEQFLIDMTRNLAEARDILATLSTTRSAEDFANLAQGILRSLHSLKGSARQFSPGIGLGSFHESAHRIENFFTHSRADNALAHEDWEKVHAEFFRLKFTIQRMREIHDRVVPPRRHSAASEKFKSQERSTPKQRSHSSTKIRLITPPRLCWYRSGRRGRRPKIDDVAHPSSNSLSL